MAVSVGDVLSALSTMKEWLRLKALPERVDALEKRLAALESEVGGAKPEPLACLRCGARMAVKAERPHPQFGFAGVKLLTVECPSCGETSTREFDPKTDPPLPR